MAPKSFKEIFAENSTIVTKGGQDLRQRFFEWYDVNSKEYDEEDVRQLRENDYYCQRFVVHSMGLNDGKDLSFDLVKTIFKWRKEFGANHMKDSDFPEEFFKCGEIFPYRKDKEGNVTVLLRLRKHERRKSKESEIFRKFVAHTMEKIDAKFDRRKHITILVDCEGVALSNIDMDLAFFMMGLIAKHYPSILSYMVVLNMPWILNAAWKIIKAWLPASIVERIIFVDEKTIYDYIDIEDLPENMGGNDQTVFPVDDPMANLPECLLTDIQSRTVAVQ